MEPNRFGYKPDWTGIKCNSNRIEPVSYTSYVSMNRIGPDRIGRGFKPNWIEPVFLGEFEGAEPPHNSQGGLGRGGGEGPPSLVAHKDSHK